MDPFKFQPTPKESEITQGKVVAECPSNIALIKYWGKYENQIPANPSVSFTLQNSKTRTRLNFYTSSELMVSVKLNGESQQKFAEKIKNYFYSIQEYLPFITSYCYEIETENTFPHSSGIASSASGFGALAKALLEMRAVLFPAISFENTLQEASFLARLGSGSACRSLYKGLVEWGSSPFVEGSSNEYGIPYPYEIHENYKDYRDTILLIHEGEKSVSSTVGHELMKNHSYAEQRFKSANENIKKLLPILRDGDLEAFNKLVEHEALTLHAMMMMSEPPFILMKPATLACIEKIWNFREKGKYALGFTLDAGANIHLLYPAKEAPLIEQFIENDLLKYTQNGKCIKDKIEF